MDRLFDIVIYIIFAVIVLYGVKCNQTSNKEEMCKRLNALRGIFALEIIVGHVIRYDCTWLYPLGKFMIISVAFFFFVSAFGMVLSFQKKGKIYFDGFLRKKVGYMLGLAILIYIVNCACDLLVPYNLGYIPSGTDIVEQFWGMTNWYIWEQIIFYILFYLVYKYVPRYRVLIMMILAIAGSLVFFTLDFIQGWYSSAWAFPMGILYGEYFEQCQTFLGKWYGKLMTLALSVLGVCSLLLPTDSIVGMVCLRNIMCIAVLMLLIYFCCYLCCDNKVSRFLGKYSTELYIAQFVLLGIAGACGWGYKFRMVFVVFATVVMALLLHPLTVKMKKVLNK